jgi:nucleoid-associated protein YgaU
MSNVMDATVTCPVCHVCVPAGSTVCPDCGQDLAALVQSARKADVLFNQALALAKAEQWASAQARLTQALEIDSQHVEARHLLARIHARAGHAVEARAEWQHVLTLSPDHAGAQAGLAWLDKAAQSAAATAAVAAKRNAQTESKQRWRAIAGTGFAFAAGIALMTLLMQPTVHATPTAVAAVPATVIVERLIVATPTPAAATDVPATIVPTKAPTEAPKEPAPTPMTTLVPTQLPAPSPTPPSPDLIAAVKERIAGQPELQGLNIVVEQDGSDIVLSGSMPSLLAKYLAEEASADTPGVARIISKLQLTNVHVVQRGENLWDIASAVYGSPRYWRTIAKANRLRAPFRVFAGQRLILPER